MAGVVSCNSTSSYIPRSKKRSQPTSRNNAGNKRNNNTIYRPADGPKTGPRNPGWSQSAPVSFVDIDMYSPDDDPTQVGIVEL